jgi:hypothetical protein
VQVDPIKPKLKPPGTKRLKLQCVVLLSTSAFEFNLRRYIMDMEGGYDYQVGTRGRLISGGQRQRIALARTLLRNTPIVLMGGARSSLTLLMTFKDKPTFENVHSGNFASRLLS